MKVYSKCKEEKLKSYRKAYREAHREERKSYNEAHKEERKAWQKAYHEAHREEQKAYNEAHKEEIKNYQKTYYETHKEEIKTRKRIWRRANLDKIAASCSKQRSQRTKGVPPWLTKEHKKDIIVKYAEAKALTESTNIPHHVDHIIPLRGKNVRGLHVPWNLQVITAKENRKKGNRLEK